MSNNQEEKMTEGCEPPPELLPCPFCGGTDGQFATDAHSPNYIGKWGWWECACGARADDVRTGYNATGWQGDAIAAWNSRVTPPATVAALVEALEQIANHPEANRELIDYGPDGQQRRWPTVREEARAALAAYREAAR